MIATHLAQKNGGYLAVLNLADSPEKEHRLQAETAAWLRDQRLLIRYRRLTRVCVATLTQAVQTEGSGVLVLGGTTLQPDALQALLDVVDCPVLLVR
jgi:hypothetical protein